MQISHFKNNFHTKAVSAHTNTNSSNQATYFLFHPWPLPIHACYYNSLWWLSSLIIICDITLIIILHVDWICLIMVGFYTQTDISKQMIIILYWAAKQQQEKWWCNYRLTHSHHYFNDRSYFCDYHKVLQLLMMSKLMWWYFLLLIASIKMRYLSFVIKWEFFL